MLSEPAEQLSAVDSAADKQIGESQGDLSRSVLDDMVTALSAVKVERAAQREDELLELEFGLDDLYGSIFDDVPRAITQSCNADEQRLAAGDGVVADQSSSLTLSGEEFDATPQPEMQVRDMVSDVPVHEMRVQDVIAQAGPPDRDYEHVTTQSRVLEIDQGDDAGDLMQPQYRDIISAAPPEGQLDPGAGDEIEQLFRQILHDAGEGSILASAPADGQAHHTGQGRKETWGKRAFVVHDDGTAEYTLKKGDTLWDVARDVLKHENPGHKPTAKEIREEVGRIAGENGIEKVARVEPGETLVISPRRQEKGEDHGKRSGGTDSDLPEGGRGRQSGDRAAGPDARSTESLADGRGSGQGAERSADAAAQTVDLAAMERAAEAINKACNEGALWGAGTDKDAVFAILKDKTEAEREAIKRAFEQKYGQTLESELRDEMSGADLDKALNLLNRKDGSADRAGHIHAVLIERGQIVSGRTDETCERDIRQTIGTMNSRQIEQLDRDYKERYGVGIREALLEDKNLSQATKEALEIYLKGTDQRQPANAAKLADIAIKAHNIDMFAEALTGAPAEVRKAFIENGGDRKLQEAFGKPELEGGKLVYESTPALERARDIVATGEVSHGRLIRDNTRWTGDNEEAIERELTRFTPAERHQYVVGRELANGRDIDGVTAEQKKEALAFYRETREALEGAGNETEVLRWEDRIVNGEETLVGKLARHRGAVLDDSMHDVLSTIENMSQKDWQRYKTDPEFRQNVEAVLTTYLNEGELDRCTSLLEKKAKYESFEAAKEFGRRSILDVIADNPPVKGSPNADRVLDAIANMNSVEQRLYRENEQYRRAVDKQIARALPEAREHLDAADHMLRLIKEGKPPAEDIVVKLYKQAAQKDTDEPRVIRDLQSAIKEDRTLRERLINPASDEYKALREALDRDEYEKYVVPLIEKGRLPIDLQVELSKGRLMEGRIDDDEQAIYRDLAALFKDKDPAARQEIEKLKTDPAFGEKVLGCLSRDERAIADYILSQGEMRLEDKIRSHMIGAGTGEEEIKALLGNLSPADKERLRGAYARKYDGDLTYDVLDELGGRDKSAARRALARESGSAEEAFDDARGEAYRSREGLGKAWVDQAWDGTGHQTDAELNAYARAMAEYSRKFEELPPQKQQELVENLQKAVELYQRSEEAAADAAVDAALIAAGIGGAAHTGGLSLKLLAFTAVAGGALKVGAKAAIQGDDYDFESQAVRDALTGAADGATVLLGPELLAQKLVEKSAAAATTRVLAEGGEALLKQGAGEALEDGMTRILARSFVSGGKEFDEQAIKALAREVAREGNAEAVEAAIKKGLKEAADPESLSRAAKQALKEVALDSGAGAVAGGLSGGARGLAEWDSSRSFSENLAVVGKSAAGGAAFGGGGAAAFSTAFKAGGSVYRNIAEHFHVQPGEKLSTAQLEEVARLTGVKDAKVRYNRDGDLVLEGKADKPAARAGDRPQAGKDGQARASDPAWSEADKYKLKDGREVPLEGDGSFWYRAGSREVPNEGLQLKVHVYTSGPQDLKRVQEILMKEMADPNSEISKLAATWKTIHPDHPPAGHAIGEGQGAKAFTLYARNPEDAARLQAKIDEVLAKHAAELPPIKAQGLDRITGESGRVGLVRDLYPGATDAAGNKGARLDAALGARIREQYGVPEGKAFTEDQLRAIEREAGLRSGSLRNTTDGDLMLTGPNSYAPRDERFYGKYYLSELRAETHPPGEKYRAPVLDGDGRPVPVLDERGRPKMENGKPVYQMQDVVSEGLTDRAAYYALAEKFGVHPVDAVVGPPASSFKSGETVKLNGKDFEVIGAEGDLVVVRSRSAGPVEGEGLPVTADRLQSEYERIGNSDYFIDSDGLFYKLRQIGDGRMELVEDWDAVAARPKSLSRESDDVSRQAKRRGDTDLERAGDKLSGLDAQQQILRDAAVEDISRQGGGNSGHEMYRAVIRDADGNVREVILRETSNHPHTAERMRKEMAAYKLGQMLGLDNEFPATVERDFVVNGQVKHGYIQDASGQRFQEQWGEGGIVDLAKQRYPDAAAGDAVSRLVKENPEIRKQVEEAFVERLIYGDIDGHPLNMVVVKEPNALTGAERVKVQNIDLDLAFPADKTPDWGPWSGQGVNARLQADFAQQPLSAEARQKIERFIQKYDTPEGRADLARAGLKPEEIAGVVGRARWLAAEGKFPKTKTRQEYMAEYAERSKK
jgi:hypothetical protein